MIVAICVVLFLPHVDRACSIFEKTVEVGSEFRVRVTDRGHPVEGLRVVLNLADKDARKIYSITDVGGYARFADLSPGSFLLSALYDGDEVQTLIVDISPSGPADTTVELAWPGRDSVTIRSVSGTLRGPDYYPTRVQGNLSLSLLEGKSARVIETAQSDSKGQFKFTTEVPSGIYYLRLNPSGVRAWDGELIHGTIPIEVDGATSQSALDLDLGGRAAGCLTASESVSQILK